MPKTQMDSITPLYDALQVHRHEYNSGDTDYSVTTLLDPPRVVHLNKRHIMDVDLFVQDMMHSFDGTASHAYMEFCLNKVAEDDGRPKYQCEQRLGKVVGDRKVSGAYDFLWLDALSLWDLKKTSCWKAIFGDKKDWTAQQNMYRLLLNEHTGMTLKELNIIAWFRDWSKYNKMRYGKEYPTFPVLRYKLPVWSFQKTRDFMEARVEYIKSYEDTPDDELPLCDYDDMWCDPDKFAVKANDRKNALRVVNSEKEAHDYISWYLAKETCKHKRAQLSIEPRPSERKRCEDWCPVNGYCNQFHAYNQMKARRK